MNSAEDDPCSDTHFLLTSSRRKTGDEDCRGAEDVDSAPREVRD